MAGSSIPAPVRARRDSLGALCAGGVVLVFSLLLLWRDPLLFWNDDYELSILPVFADVARSWSEGHFPLLSPYSWGCNNLAGEFQYGTFSVFVNAAVVLIWKFPLTFPQQAAALSIIHLVVLAMGGYLLARGRSLAAPLAMMVAMVAALNGWMVCWGAIDWFGALGAFAWLPWAWWAFERALDPRRGRHRFVWPAPFVYLLVTGGFPYTVLMLALLVAWFAIKSCVETRSVTVLWPLALGSALGLGLSSPAWLALFDYLHGSARQLQESAAHFQWIVPPASLPAFILPAWTVNWADFSTRLMPHTATEMACGLIPPLALISGLILYRGTLVRRLRWELGLLVAVLIISMMPTADVFRWSFRWLPFLHVILALCAAEALQGVGRDGARRKFLTLGTLGFTIVAVTISVMWMLRLGGEHAQPFVWIMLLIAAIWALADVLFTRSADVRHWLAPCMTFAALLATYLCIPPNCGVPKYNLSQTLTAPSPLDASRRYLSAYPWPEHTYRVEKKPGPIGQVVRPGSTSMWGAVRFINGYSPIRPAGVAREYDFGIHGEIDYGIAERLLQSEAGPTGQLAQLGVDGLILAPEMGLPPPPADEWQIAYSFDEGTVYHRRGPPLAPVRSLTSASSRPNEQFARASITVVEDSRNRVVADVDVPSGERPALLSFSRPFFPGYRAHAGSARLKVTSYRGLFPTVEIPAGTIAQLVLEYRPWWLTSGAIAAAICALVTLAAVVLALLDRRKA